MESELVGGGAGEAPSGWGCSVCTSVASEGWNQTELPGPESAHFCLALPTWVGSPWSHRWGPLLEAMRHSTRNEGSAHRPHSFIGQLCDFELVTRPL